MTLLSVLKVVGSLTSNLNRFLLLFEEMSGLKNDKPSVLAGINCGGEVG